MPGKIDISRSKLLKNKNNNDNKKNSLQTPEGLIRKIRANTKEHWQENKNLMQLYYG